MVYSRMPLSCSEPRILNTLMARHISPRISTYCNIKMVSVMVEIWESVMAWDPINWSVVFVKKPVISSCLAKPVTPITNWRKALLLTPRARAERESIAMREGLNSAISDLMICK